MQPREVVRAIFDKQIPERMGLNESFWPETLSEAWPKEGFPKGADPVEEFRYDVRSVGGWFDSSPFRGVWEVLDENEEWRVVRDGRGATLKFWKHKSGTPEHIDFECSSPEVWFAKYREPLLETDPGRLADVEGGRAAIQECKARGIYSCYSNLFVFELMRATIGDQNFLPAMLEDPAWIEDFCRVNTDFLIRHYEILFREAGLPDAFFLYEDLGYSNGPFCSPATLRELWLPHAKRFVGFLKDHGLQVMLHSCGDVRMLVPLIVEAGVDVLQPLEAKAGCDVLRLGEAFAGRLGFMGNIDVRALSTNDAAKVREEVVGKLTAIRERRIPYVFHSDHSIPPDVSLGTYRLALDLFWEHCRY
ncbi:MAG: hypothetical protein N2109_11575 [Fimbriimonadales bacterium]|nr:hypothetical protein [Fimbriimonadales bacterium]